MEKVLVADDDPGIRDVIATVLSAEGYSVLEAANGRDAVSITRQQRPRVVLMDIMMPVLDGAEAIRWIKEDPTTAWIRVIAMSAGINLHRQTERLILADGLLAKPFDLDVLLAQVELGLRQATPPDEASILEPNP